MTYKNEQNTNILYKGNKIDPNRVSDPEVMPLYLSTAHNVADLDDLQNTYDRKGYAYTRSHNANRDGIAQKSINWTIFIQLIRRHLRYDCDYKN
ncbi:hypothetical protein [Leuconostoc mesenteroides]|uniref:hypothetical protein n=1 Tax=Leuconostoc mesenteroides TaxID=1245 RepID=UPI00218219E7|nr:hypothetical protein [Leuconostoc mesenteroides]